MKFIRNTFKFAFLVVNLIVGICFLICAYSPFVSPVEHSVWACAGLFIPAFIILNLCFLVFWMFVKWKMAIVPIAFFLLGWDSLVSYCPINFPDESSGGDSLKILTYNVMQMQSKKGSDVNPIVEYIKESDADIVCMQEYPFHNSNIKKEIQRTYPYVKTCKVNNGNTVACFSKYPVSFIEEIKVKSMYNGSAVFKVKYKGKDIPVIVNNLESNKLDAHDKEVYTDMLKAPDEEKVKSGSKHLLKKLADAMSIRGPQADIIAEYIQKEYSPYMIVCGDFNDTPVSYVHNRISKKLHDAFIEAGNGPGITYNRNFLYFRIDHVMVGSAYRVLECKVDDSIDASDHYPLWCMLEINF